MGGSNSDPTTTPEEASAEASVFHDLAAEIDSNEQTDPPVDEFAAVGNDTAADPTAAADDLYGLANGLSSTKKEAAPSGVVKSEAFIKSESGRFEGTSEATVVESLDQKILITDCATVAKMSHVERINFILESLDVDLYGRLTIREAKRLFSKLLGIPQRVIPDHDKELLSFVRLQRQEAP